MDELRDARVASDAFPGELLADVIPAEVIATLVPNFYFHAVTAYDILRTRGVPLGKRDYEGWLRTRTA
jgi:uncharacterized protein